MGYTTIAADMAFAGDIVAFDRIRKFCHMNNGKICKADAIQIIESVSWLDISSYDPGEVLDSMCGFGVVKIQGNYVILISCGQVSK